MMSHRTYKLCRLDEYKVLLMIITVLRIYQGTYKNLEYKEYKIQEGVVRLPEIYQIMHKIL